jgi:predicted ATP-grasp superfamily ATP-dependent carboligase
VLAALGTLAEGREPCGVVCGSGFEDRPALLGEIARRWALLGNDPETVARIKDPLAFAAICRTCAIPHPSTALDPPAEPAQWLIKRAGGAGGLHVRRARAEDTAEPGRYFQRQVAGESISALLLADGRHALVLGFSVQWPAPSAQHPYRYGGAARPASLAPGIERRLRDAIRRLMAEVPLRGLNSADFLVDGNEFRLLEINPRPGATIDIFEPQEGSLFALHVAACRGTLPQIAPQFGPPSAAATVYAERDLRIPDIAWPDWMADRSYPGTRIAAGDPVCTVLAAAETAEAAKALVGHRAQIIHAAIDAVPA